jgi:preprotein translocase subunit YajC
VAEEKENVMAAETATTATTAAPGAPGAAPAANPLMSFTPILVVCAILYFLVIRPQQKQAKEHRKMVDSLKSGDRVLTQGGLYGTVVSLKQGVVILKIADDVKVEVTRGAITQVILEPATNGSGKPQGVAG